MREKRFLPTIPTTFYVSHCNLGGVLVVGRGVLPTTIPLSYPLPLGKFLDFCAFSCISLKNLLSLQG